MSHIKGGGRASLSEESEHALVDCLMKCRRCWPGDDNTSTHALQRERKRFVKRLVERYERTLAHTHFNPTAPKTKSSSSSSNDNNNITPTAPSSIASSTTATDPSSKVRFELIEAIGTVNHNKKGDSSNDFKRGLKKLMVLPRTTTVLELMALAQSKLRMKKSPVRVFLLMGSTTTSSTTKRQQIDLQHTLTGVKDDSVLYVTSTSVRANDEEDASVIEGGVAPEKEDLEDAEDSLEAVKHAYYHAQKYAQSRSVRNQQPSVDLPMEHPTFSDHFDLLPGLCQSSAELPAANARQEVLEAVEKNHVVILSGETGCGKSTQVPQFLWQGLQAAGSKYANILVTQPRKVAATTLASRVAEEMNSPAPGQPGSLVGHHVRLDRAVSDTAQIVYCTVGILLRKIVSPPMNKKKHDDDEDTHLALSEYTHLIIDEVHERDVTTDFLLTLLRAALPKNPQLRVVLMSATASSGLFVEYFAKFQPVVVNIPGRTFPVETKWLVDCQRLAGRILQDYGDDVNEQVEESLGVPLSPLASIAIDNHFIEALIASIVRQQKIHGNVIEGDGSRVRTSGAIVVFLPGKSEIEALFRVLIRGANLSNKEDIKIYKLHSGVSRKVQKAVFESVSSGKIKIVLSTNVAETSITIPDASHIIDTGRVKESRYNAGTRLKELVTVWTSQASATQRSGRAGRTCPGVCYRLYSQSFFEHHFPKQTTPEMVRTPLDELILQVCLLYEQQRKPGSSVGVNPSLLLNQVPEPPSTTSLEKACQHLMDVGALVPVADENFRLTPLGFHLSRLPMDPKVGKVLIVGCLLGCAENALTVAAALSCPKSCFYHRFGGIIDRQYEESVDRRAQIIEQGFGGKDWRGGTVKGDFMAVIACYRAWQECPTDQDRALFARDHALDHNVMNDIKELRRSFGDMLQEAGFCGEGYGEPPNHHGEDALLTSACWVAGLYPNICTLIRPRKGGPKGGRLLTKEGDICRPQLQSFQRSRVQRAAETGKDAYAVYHTKHRSVTSMSQSKNGEVFLSNVNFVSRYALLLFSGALHVEKNAVIVDGWLKFKIGETGKAGAVLMLAIRRELDAMLLTQIAGGAETRTETKELLAVVRQLLADE